MSDVSQIVNFLDRPSVSDRVSELARRYAGIRRQTLQLTAPLAPEDQVIQSMSDVSPTRWHLAHTTWFFETFVLKEAWPDYQPFDASYAALFNSYYLTVGKPFPRSQRGMLSRPTCAEILAYREAIDQKLLEGLERGDERWVSLLPVLELGLHHEQQHQELILTDIKYVFAQNPLYPVYHRRLSSVDRDAMSLHWVSFEERLTEVGWAGSDFSFDNERPRHRVFLESFQFATRLVTNLEYMEFMADQGYEQSALWLSDGWNWVQEDNVHAPLYWFLKDGQWWHYTLSGARPVDLHEPVVHVSYYEADAFARWAGVRLPREEEWEVAASTQPVTGNFLESGVYHPQASVGEGRVMRQLFGDVWEWTQSPYVPYPRYQPLEKSLGEYNGKFMCNQMVLRGGSCVTPQSHMRATYRNFFYPHQRWQFMGIRLAKDVQSQGDLRGIPRGATC